jgi:hypothetical protein
MHQHSLMIAHLFARPDSSACRPGPRSSISQVKYAPKIPFVRHSCYPGPSLVFEGVLLTLMHVLMPQLYDHHRPPPNSFHIIPPTTPNTPSLSPSTSMSPTLTASPPGMYCSYLSVSASPGIPKHEPVPVPPPSHSRTATIA